MSNITIPVDIEDIKAAVSNYNTIYSYVSQQANSKLKEYEGTIIKRKLFGFIPWFNTTQYDKLGFNGDKYTRSCAEHKLHQELYRLINNDNSNYECRPLLNCVLTDLFSSYNDPHNNHTLYLEFKHIINKVEYGYNRDTPTTLNVSQFAYDFINKYKDVNLSSLK